VSVGPGPILRLSLPESGPVKIQLFDLAGRLVKTLADNSEFPAGDHLFTAQAAAAQGGLSSGMYFYRVETARGFARGKLIVAH
jgi:hypothetical protein